MQDNTLQQYISQSQAGEELKITRSAVSNLIKRGVLKAHDIAGRKVLTQTEIERYKKERMPAGWTGYHAKRAKSLKKKNNKKERIYT